MSETIRSLALALLLATPVLAQGQATIPERFRGRWAGSLAQCRIPSESSLEIDADHIGFYESRGRVLAVKVVSEREVEVTLELSGERQTWRSMSRFRLSEDGRSLTDVTRQDHQFVRVRCAKQTKE